MKYDDYEIQYLEKENAAIWIYNLQKKHQYLYIKLRRRCPEKIFCIPITLQNGKQHNVKFVRLSDLEELKQRDYRLEQRKKK